METTSQINGLSVQITADEIRFAGEEVRLKGARVRLRLPHRPARYLRHGWQSWSLAAWTEPVPIPVQNPRILHPMQDHPKYVTESLPHGSWLGAVEFPDGRVLLLGALSLDTHVQLDGDVLEGWSDAGEAEWLAVCGEEQAVFNRYTGAVGKVLGQSQKKAAPRIWCSWYSLYTAIDEPLLNRIIEEIAAFHFDLIQVDDGWQQGIGDWEPNAKFSSGMEALAGKIISTGRRAGLWLAPLIAAKDSRLFRSHPEWFVRDERGGFVSAGFNWGRQLYALDTTHPEALAWLEALMRRVRGWGFDYLKLDFLYAGALPGKRHQDLPPEQAYRMGMKVLREGMGGEAYFLACGAPILPSLGLCDALRVGPDVAGEWESHRDAVLLSNYSTPGTRNAIRTTLHELWLRPLVQLDPDVAYFGGHGNSLSAEQKKALQDLALICGFKATSDLPQWLSAEEQNELRAFLEDEPRVMQTGRYRFEIDGRTVDFAEVQSLPATASGTDALLAPLLGWVANQPLALRAFDWLNKRSLEKLRRELNTP